MLAYLKGKILHRGKYLILENQGLGYKVFVTEKLSLTCKVEEELALYLHYQQKEDGVELFGFNTFSELEFFEQLISVSGVGPRIGLSLISQFDPDKLKQSIIHSDTSLLEQAHGIGKKTAARLVLELKSKLEIFPDQNYTSFTSADTEVLEALVSLGYSKQEALKAVESLDPKLTSTEKIREALRCLGKNKLR